MATPVLNATTNKPVFAAGEPITVSWTVTDADNSNEQLVLSGVDGQGNAVSVTLDVARTDIFTMQVAKWVRTNVSLTIDNVARRATGTMPTA